MSVPPDIFLSYSRDDQAMARRFADGFEKAGFSVWWDVTLKSGEDYDKVTEDALRTAKAVVVLWSKKSVESRWVRAEATEADSLGTLVPVMIEPCKRPIMFELKQSAELSHWKGNTNDAAWLALVNDLRRFVGRDAAAKAPQSGLAMPAKKPWHQRTGNQILLTILVSLVLAAALLPLRTMKAPAANANASSQANAVANSVAVLPFKNISTDPEQEAFADGLTEEILNSLAGIAQLQVAGRTSSFFFKGKDTDLREIGKALQVNYLLEGSVRKSGQQIKISAQLIDSQSGLQLWSLPSEERPLEDIFKIQEDIARSVATALQITLGVGDLAQRPGMTRNAAAYEYFVAAFPLVTQMTLASETRAQQLLQQATDLDPQFALAWLTLGSARGIANVMQGGRESAEARAAFDKARQLAPELPNLDLQQTQSSFERYDWPAAAKSIERYRAKAHDHLDDLYQGRLLVFTGHFREAINFLRSARQRDPLQPIYSDSLALSLAASSQMEAAAAEMENFAAVTNRPVSEWKLQWELMQRKRPTTLDAFIKDDYTKLQVSASIKPLVDKREQALGKLRELEKLATSVVELQHIMMWAGYYDDAPLQLKVLQHLNTFTSGRGLATPPRLWLPSLRSSWQTAEFKQLLRDMNLVDYWRQSGWPDYCKPVGADDFECK